MGLKSKLLDWAAKRVALSSLVSAGGGQSGGYTDSFHSEPAPADVELMEAFTDIAYSAAMINASACATIPLKLFVTTTSGQAKPKCGVAPINKGTHDFLREGPMRQKLVNAQRVEEVTDHQILTSLRAGNEEMHGYDMMHLTSTYLDVVGRVFWGMKESAFAALGQPPEMWLLPPHQTESKTDAGGGINPAGAITHYEWKPNGQLGKSQTFKKEDVLNFRLASLQDPYRECWSPLRAAWEKIRWLNLDSAESNALVKNRSMPEIIVSPKDQTDIIGDDEAKRLEKMFLSKFHARRMGGVYISRTPLDVSAPARTSRDDERSIRFTIYKNIVLNAFGVPIALFEAKQINRATLEAAMVQHGKFTVLPRLMYIVQVLNHRFVSRFDQRLFLWFENPIPKDEEKLALVREKNLKNLVTTVNEERAVQERGPVDWGDRPWRDQTLIPIDTPVLDPNKAAEKKAEDAKKLEGEKPKPKKSDKEFLGRVTLILDHAAKRIETFQAVKQLSAMGVDTEEACKWLVPRATQEVKSGEAPQEPTLPTWYEEGDTGGHRRAMPVGSKIEKVMRKYFREQREYVISVMRASVLRSTDYRLKVFGEDNLDFVPWTATLRELIQPVLEIEFQRGAADAAKRLRIDAIRVQDPHVREAVQRLSMQFAQSTNSTTTLELKDAMKRLKERMGDVMTGDENTLSELTKAVQEIFDQAEEFRAKRIAVTESSRAVHLAQRMTGEKSGIVKGWDWLLSSDACPLCQSIKAQSPEGIPMGGTFAVVSDNPIYGEIKEPPAHPNCQCTMVEKIDWDALKG